jgi:hypothetical protein
METNMKKAKLISLLVLAMTTSKVFAYTSSAHVCNKTPDTNFEFKLVYNHQANVIGADSYDFILTPEGCKDINFYMEDSSLITANDDDLLFVDQKNPHNSFHIKNSDYNLGAGKHNSILDSFYMPNYSYGDYIPGLSNDNNTDQNQEMHFNIYQQ